MNPSAGRTDLPDFESGPFNHLGTSPYIHFTGKSPGTYTVYHTAAPFATVFYPICGLLLFGEFNFGYLRQK